MTEPAILFDTAETTAFLRERELERDGLIEALRFADGLRALCTANDARGFDLITMNAKAARALREIFGGDRWFKDENDNQPGIYNPHLKMRVIPCNFDQECREPSRRPDQFSRKRRSIS